MNPGLVSIIIPLNNAEKYIEDTLGSVKGQTYPNWECLIIDDGSSDSSKKIALDYCNKDERFKYYYQDNSGPSAARNKGVKLAQGDYIQYLDADDVLLPKRLEVMIENCKSLKKNMILYSNLLLGDEKNIYVTRPMHKPANAGYDITFLDMYRSFALDFLFIPSCLFFPHHIIKNKIWNQSLNHSEDWDYYLQILVEGNVLRFYPEPLVIYRNTLVGLSKNLEKTIQANYRILFDWVTSENLVTFSKRCAMLYNRSIFYFLNSQIKNVIEPKFDSKKKSFHLQLFIFLIFPLALYYFMLELLKSLFKRTIKVFKKIAI